MRFRRSWRVLATATVVALSLIVAGCADPVEDNPKKAFVDAVKALGDEPGATVTARVVGNANNIVSVAAAEGEQLDVEDVQRVFDSAVAVSWHEGEDADDPDDDQGQFVLTVDGGDAVELRYDGADLYLRADVQGLVGLSDDMPSAEEIESVLDELEASGFDFARPAYEGRWLRLAGAEQAQSFFEGLVAAGGEEAADTTEQADRFTDAARSALRDLLRDDVEVTYVGADSVGEKVIASVRLGALAEAFIEVLETEDFGLGSWGLDPAELRSELAAAAAADEVIEVEAWITGGLLRQVRLDLVGLARQFDEPDEVPAGLDPIHLELAFDDFRDGVTAPDDAVEVDLFKVMGQSMGGLGSGFGDLDGGDFGWDDDADWDEGVDWGRGDRANPVPDVPEGGQVPGTAPPDWDQLDQPDWDQMTEEEFDEWMREFERQLEEAPR